MHISTPEVLKSFAAYPIDRDIHDLDQHRVPLMFAINARQVPRWQRVIALSMSEFKRVCVCGEERLKCFSFTADFFFSPPDAFK